MKTRRDNGKLVGFFYYFLIIDKNGEKYYFLDEKEAEIVLETKKSTIKPGKEIYISEKPIYRDEKIKIYEVIEPIFRKTKTYVPKNVKIIKNEEDKIQKLEEMYIATRRNGVFFAPKKNKAVGYLLFSLFLSSLFLSPLSAYYVDIGGKDTGTDWQKYCPTECVFQVGEEKYYVKNGYVNIFLSSPLEKIDYTWKEEDKIEKNTIQICQKQEDQEKIIINCQKPEKIYFSPDCQEEKGIIPKKSFFFWKNQSGCVMWEDKILQTVQKKEEWKLVSKIKKINNNWYLYISTNQPTECRIEDTNTYIDIQDIYIEKYVYVPIQMQEYAKTKYPVVSLSCQTKNGEKKEITTYWKEEEKEEKPIWPYILFGGIVGLLIWLWNEKKKEREKMENQVDVEIEKKRI